MGLVVSYLWIFQKFFYIIDHDLLKALGLNAKPGKYGFDAEPLRFCL